MKYVIMCGGTYKEFEVPKQLSEINGERLADRTVRLLKKYGAGDIYISSNDKRFDSCGVPRLEFKNDYVLAAGGESGYWLDAFYPNFEDDEKVIYFWGDVYYTDEAIQTIVGYKTDKNVLFGTSDAKNELHENWGEPFAYIVNDYATFMAGVRVVKKLQDEGKVNRMPIVWELYRCLNGLDVNIQAVLDDTFVVIDDGTIDVDHPEHIEMISRRFG